jgi:hypothetical protein
MIHLQRRCSKNSAASLVALCERRLPCFLLTLLFSGVAISIAADLFLTTAEYELRDLTIPLRISELRDRAPLVGAGFAWPGDASILETACERVCLHFFASSNQIYSEGQIERDVMFISRER